MAAEAIGNLYARLGINTVGFDSGITASQAKLREFGKIDFGKGIKTGLGEVEGGLQNLTSGLGIAGNMLGALGITGAAAGAAIAVAFSGARDAMAFGDEIGDTAAKLQVTTDYLQEMRFAAHGLGGDFKDADDALEGFTKTFGLATSGLSSKAIKPFEALGLDPKSFGSVEEALNATIDKIAALGSAAEQAAVADRLGLTPLLPAIREGTAAIDEMRAEAQRLGFVMDASLIEKAGAANDEYEALSRILDVEFKSAMAEAIPLVVELTRMMVGGARAAGDFAAGLSKVLGVGRDPAEMARQGIAQADAMLARDPSNTVAKANKAKFQAQLDQEYKNFVADMNRQRSAALDTGRGGGASLSATSDAKAAADRRAAEASRTAAAAERERAAALKALSDEMRAAEERSADFAAGLLEEVSTMGMSSRQLKERQIALEAAAAPTEALANFIRLVGDQWIAQTDVADAWAAKLKEVNTQQGETIALFDALGVAVPSAMSKTIMEMDESARAARALRFDIEDIAAAINNNDWASGFAGLLKVLAQVDVALGKNATSLQKMQALAGIGMGVGSLVGGTAGAGISGAASGALGGMSLVSSLAATGTIIPGIGNIAGAAIGAVIGGLGSIFGSSKAKKQQKAQEAAQRAAEEAQRQQQIADAALQLRIDLLKAQGKAEEAVALEHQAVLDKLAKMDPSLVALQQELWATQEASEAAAKAAELQAEVLAREVEARKVQRGIMLQLMSLDDAVTGGNSAVLAAREDELALLDPVSQQLKRIYYARLDEADALAKQQAATEAAAKAEADAAEAAQAINLGLMRQLMTMDDAVLGTTSARDAARADELAKLDETGRKLQTIIWAREDEAEAIAKQQAASEAAAAAAEEVARRMAEVLQQRTDLENQLLVAIGLTARATERQREAALAALDPSLRGLQSLLWGVEDSTAAVAEAESALADARSAASQAYERETSAVQATIDKFKAFATNLKTFRTSLDTGPMAALNPLQQYARTKADFERVAGLAASGNEDALGQLQGVSEAYLEASKAAQATNVGYFKDLGAVKRATEAAQKFADQQVDQGSAQLAALQAQLSALGIVNTSVLSIGQAVGNVASAIDALARATVAKAGAEQAAKNALANAGLIPKSATGEISIAANDNADLAAAKAIYLSATGGISSELFNRYVGANPFPTFARLGYDGDIEALRKKFGFATGGSFEVGGWGGPDSQLVPLHLSPGEVGNITRADVMEQLLNGVAGLGDRLSSMEAALIAITISNNSMDRRERRAESLGLYVRGSEPDSPVKTEVA